jgi:uncharacterized protein (TIGR01777 family)
VKLSFRSTFGVPREALAAYHFAPRAFERLNPPFDPVEWVEHSGIVEGARTTVRLPFGPTRVTMTVEHTQVRPGHGFVDVQREGPFERFSNVHRFVDDGSGSAREDELELVPPLGALGKIGSASLAARTEASMRYRHRLLALDLPRHAAFADRPRLTVAITGASGLVGSTLADFLAVGGHTVRRMKRTSADGIDAAALEGADVVVHLAGAGIADQRWSPERKKELLASRVDFTRALVKRMRSLAKPPKVLVSASGITVYGDRGDEVLDEGSAAGEAGDRGAAFLTRICHGWEGAALEARDFTRVAVARFGAVLSAKGGALAKMLPALSAGAAGPLAGGKQWMSWACLEDVVGALHQLIWREELSGVFNVVSPEPLRNAEFMKRAAAVLGRPAFIPAPAFALKLAFGEMAEATLLPSQRVAPKRLVEGGFVFAHPALEQCLRFTLGK